MFISAFAIVRISVVIIAQSKYWILKKLQSITTFENRYQVRVYEKLDENQLLYL